MGLDMTTKEYTKLWKRFDISGDGKISYAEVGCLFDDASRLGLPHVEDDRA